MVKTTFYFFLISCIITITSCRRSNGDYTAQNICDCYNSIHDESARSDSEEELEAKVKVCNKLLTAALDSFEKEDRKRASFMKSYRACQEN